MTPSFAFRLAVACAHDRLPFVCYVLPPAAVPLNGELADRVAANDDPRGPEDA